MSSKYNTTAVCMKSEPDHASYDAEDCSIDILELSLCSYNCLRTAGVHTVGELLQKSETDLLRYPNFGVSSLQEVASKVKTWCAEFEISGTKLQKSIAERELRVNSSLY